MDIVLHYKNNSHPIHAVSSEVYEQMKSDARAVPPSPKTYPELPNGIIRVDWKDVLSIEELPPQPNNPPPSNPPSEPW